MTNYLDTQLVVWLGEARLDRLTPRAQAALEDGELAISPMVLLELEYLYEIHRIVRPPLALAQQLSNQIGLEIQDAGFAAMIGTAISETWTRDPFDRIIVAHARADSALARLSVKCPDRIRRTGRQRPATQPIAAFDVEPNRESPLIEPD